MSDPATETVCGDCGHRPDEPNDYCPECGAEGPWEVQYLYDWKDVDLPVVFSFEHYNDTYGLWHEFTTAVFGTRLGSDEIAHCPGIQRDMKYCVVQTYWKLTENLKVKGPFLDKKEAKEA
jgi:hypothetical protein